ncbi:MAG TPA: SDR family NAD(P)-dependent oxidoreductase, partial [Sporichthya sp.]|nr:SDR family NAD(P)-dependent oxidoreductase [Sporichthya sp.]
MKLTGTAAVVTGGASGLGLASVRALLARGAGVVLLDLPSSEGEVVAKELGSSAAFVPGDVTDPEPVAAAMAAAAQFGPLRSVIHCAGRGHTMRVLTREGEPSSLVDFEALVRTNLIGSFNVLSQGAAVIARTEPVEGERGVIVMTASVAAWEGQIGQ